MSLGRIIIPLAEPVLKSGAPVSGALLRIYENNTTTLAEIWQDSEGTVAATNPQTSDAQGRFYSQSTVLWADNSKLFTVSLLYPDGQVITYDDIAPDRAAFSFVGFDTKNLAEDANVTSGVNILVLYGYGEAGDMSPANYKRVASAPSHPGKLETNGGTVHWELFGDASLETFGGKRGPSHNNRTAYDNLTLYLEATGNTGHIRGGDWYFKAQTRKINGKVDIRGAGQVETIFWKDFVADAGDQDRGLVHFEPTSSNDPNGSYFGGVTIQSTRAGTNGTGLTLKAHPDRALSSITVEDVTVTTSWLSGDPYSWSSAILIDGSPRTTEAAGVRVTNFRNVKAFGAAGYSVRIISAKSLYWTGGVYPAGSDTATSGAVQITGSSSNISTQITAHLDTVDGLNLTHMDDCDITINRLGSVSGVAIADAATVERVVVRANFVGGSVTNNWRNSRLETTTDPGGIPAEDLGLVGDGTTINSASLVASVLSTIEGELNWGGPEKVYCFDAPINITRPNQSWLGSATLKLVKASGSAVCPLVILQKTATDFYASPQITYDHDAENLVAPVLANQIAFVYGCCFLAMAPRFNIGGRFYNTWDNGLGICEVAFTGEGTVSSPLSAVQTLASPQGWVTTEIYGENCGCGVHGGQFGENGKKGAVVNALTAADGIIGPVTGKNNYGGLIVDFGGGAEGTVLGAHFYGTIVDPDFPSNGSGIDYWFGSGKINVGPIQSHNAGRYGVAVPEYAGEVAFSSAMVHAAQQQGVVVNGGRISGTFTISDCGLAADDTYAAFDVEAVENVDLNISILAFSAASNPDKHSFGYQSSAASGKVVRGQVRLHSVGHGTSAASPAADRTTLESLFVSDATPGVEMFGPLAVGTQSLPADATTDLTLGRDLSTGVNTGHLFNCYYDNVTTQYKFLGNGWASYVKSNNVTGKIDIFQSTTQNAAGAGAVATMRRVSELDTQLPIWARHYANMGAAVDAALTENRPLYLSAGEAATIGVPSTIATLGLAISTIRNWSIPAGATLTIQVADGDYSLTSSLVVTHPDGARIRILGNVTTPASCILRATSANDILYVPGGYSLGSDGFVGFNGFNLIKDGTKARIGVLTDGGSVVCGSKLKIDNFYYGLAARYQGRIIANGTSGSDRVHVTSAGDVGIWAFQGSHISCAYALVEGSVDAANDLGFGIMAEYNSSIDCQYATATGNHRAGIASFSGSGVRAYNSTVSDNTGTASGANGYMALGGYIAAHSGTSTGNSGWGSWADDAGTVDANPAITYSSNTLGNLRPMIRAEHIGAGGARLVPVGGGTNEPMRLDSKGTGGLFFNTSGGLSFSVSYVASAVNYPNARPAATGGIVQYEAQGSDTNIPAALVAKGNSSARLVSNGVTAMEAVSNSGANTYVLMRARDAAGGAAIQVISGGTNADLVLEPKGTGRLKYGTHTGSADAPISGYIEILDSGGNLRKLAVIS